jgi:tRNA threonylcarbamoyladenosine biosynthesis protein TsaB
VAGTRTLLPVDAAIAESRHPLDFSPRALLHQPLAADHRPRSIRSYRVLILALDTTTRGGSAAVVRDETLLSLVRGDATRTHGERLPGELSAALAQAGVAVPSLDLLVVASGPGAFTGLRIGLAAMQGLAMVTGVPVIGVSALDAIAAALWPGLATRGDMPRLIVWLDAQRQEIFEGRYVPGDTAGELPWRLAQEVTVATPEAALDALSEDWRSAVFAGDGASRAQPQIAAWARQPVSIVPAPDALAPALAGLGALRARRGAAGPPHALQPLYVRRPDAELDRARRATS